MKRTLRFGGFGAALTVAAVFATLGLVPRSALASSPLAVFVTNFPATQAASQSGAWNVGITNVPAVSQSGSWTVGLDGTDAGNMAKLGGLTYDAGGNLKVAGAVAATQSGTWTTGLDGADSGHLAKLDGLSFSGGALNVNVTNPPAAQSATIRRIDLITGDTGVSTGAYYLTAALDTSDCRAMYVAFSDSGSGLVALLAPLDSAGAIIGNVGPVPIASSVAGSEIDFFPLTQASPPGPLAFQWPYVKVALQNEGDGDVTVHRAALYCIP